MRYIKYFLLGLLLVALVLSCDLSNDNCVPGNTTQETVSTNAKVSRAMNFVGEVANIYTKNSRFYDGQIIKFRIDGKEQYVYFSGYLVEYTKLNEDFISYIDSIDKPYDGLFNQGYNIQMDPNMKYVEFGVYYNLFTGDPFLYDLRIGYPPTPGESNWHTKTTRFNTDFTIDYSAGGILVDLKFDEFQEIIPENVYFTGRQMMLKQGSDDLSIIIKLDTFSDKKCTIEGKYLDSDLVWNKFSCEVAEGEGHYYIVVPYVRKSFIGKTFKISLKDDEHIYDSFELDLSSNAEYLLETGFHEIPEGYEEIKTL